MGRDDISDAWANKLETPEARSSPTATNNEALRKAMAINPALAQSLGSDKPAAAKEGPKSVAEVLSSERQKLVGERKRIKDEIAKLQVIEKALPSKTLEKVMEGILNLDAELKAKGSEDAVRQEAVFLTEIGFTKDKLRERRAFKKK